MNQIMKTIKKIHLGIDRIGKLTHKIMRISKYKLKGYISDYFAGGRLYETVFYETVWIIYKQVCCQKADYNSCLAYKFTSERIDLFFMPFFFHKLAVPDCKFKHPYVAFIIINYTQANIKHSSAIFITVLIGASAL